MIIKIDKKLASIEKIIDKIKPPIDIDFDIGIVKKLKNSEFVPFRNDFLKLIHALRIKKININYDSIRMQSIKYNALLVGPQTLSLKISGVCNYSCKFCGAHSSISKLRTRSLTKHFMHYENIKNIVDNAFTMGVENIYLTGLGEPFLHPQIMDIISYIAKRGFKITIFTNASIYKVTSEILKLPSSYKLLFVVNLSATDRIKYARIHGVDPEFFTRTLESIRNLNQRHKVLLSYIFNKDNSGDIFKFIVLANSIGIKNLQFKFMTENNTEYKKLACSHKQLAILLRNLNRIKTLCKNYGMEVDLSPILGYFWQKTRKITTLPCFHGWFTPLIGLDGDIYNCCMKKTPIGYINSGNFKKSFFSLPYERAVLEGKKGNDINSEEWKKCKYCISLSRNTTISALLK